MLKRDAREERYREIEEATREWDRKYREAWDGMLNADHKTAAEIALRSDLRDADGGFRFMPHALSHALLALVEELREE